MTSPNWLELKFAHMARFTLQADSGFSIMSGITDVAFDNLVVRDANGLPALPGTTLAGVLRAMYSDHFPGESIGILFGEQRNSAEENTQGDGPGTRSRVEVSWGVIHDRNNAPVEGLMSVPNDHVLEFLLQDHPITRDQVALNERGVAEYRKKFDFTLVPKGCRFSVEVMLWSAVRNPPEWNNLKQLIRYGRWVLGARGSSGHGRFGCKVLKTASFDLSAPGEFDAFAESSRSVTPPNDWDDYQTKNTLQALTTRFSMVLSPEDFWRVGEGPAPLRDKPVTPHLVPRHEVEIIWNTDNRASLADGQLVFPGTSLKGALRHRFRFHYERLRQACDGNLAEADTAVREMFGVEADTSDPINPGGHKSRLQVICSDISILQPGTELVHLTHSSIDRFTGGARDGALFVEEVLWMANLDIELEIEHTHLDRGDDSSGQCNPTKLVEALMMTLNDLREGRLALGAGSSRGLGYFKGEGITWLSDKPDWWPQNEELAHV